LKSLLPLRQRGEFIYKSALKWLTPLIGGMHNFIGNRIGFDCFSIGSSTLGIGPEKINKNSIGSDKIPIESDSVA
jgi:hypothetical protein